MKLLISPDNFNEFFSQKRTFIASRHSGYQHEVTHIEKLALQADERDIREIIRYLRPWNIEQEGNWMGREWLRSVAMQTLCYLGTQNSKVKDYLKSIISSNEDEWRAYDETLRKTWRELTDTSCLVDPYADFIKCVREVIKCIEGKT